MRSQTLLIVVLALVFGGVAAGGVFLFSSRDPAEGVAMTTIVVAAADVPRGEAISADSVVARKYPKDLVPAGVLTKIEDAVGRSALSPLVKDEPLLDAKLAPKGTVRGLANLIKTGMRAITIPTPNVATGVAGFIVPGSRVDILWTPQDTGRGDRTSAEEIPLLENVEILAVDEKIDAPVANRMDVGQMKSVTVQVKPEEASKLSPALTKGVIHLSLRNPRDDGRVALKPVTTVVSPTRRLPTAPPPVIFKMIRTVRGTQEGVIRVNTSEALTRAR